MSHDEHWYDVVTNDQLRQGDILPGVAIPHFGADLIEALAAIDAAKDGDQLTVPVKLARGDWIILDASCDVDRAEGRPPAITQVIVARVLPADLQGLAAKNEKELNERRELLRLGLSPSKFLLAACPRLQPAFPLSFVEYRQRFMLPHAYLCAVVERIGSRLRMRHPFRERFGTWVGTALSRVGPENDGLIPPFVPRLHDAQRLRAAAGLADEN